MTATIAEEYLHLIESIGDRMDIPAIKSVHIASADQGPEKSSKFGAMVLDDGTTGLTYTGLDDALVDLQDTSRVTNLISRSPVEAAQLYAGEAGWQRSLGMAAINAVSQFLFKQSGYSLPPMGKTLAQVDVRLDDHIGMVGYFPPLVAQVRATHTRLTVLELDERWLQEEDEFLVTLDPGGLADCNKIVCTGTVLVNHTVDAVLESCMPGAEILIVGPTVGCLPDPLFDRGVTTLGSTRVVDPRQFLDLWSSQQKWRDSTRRYALNQASGYPGVEALLSMAESGT